VNGPLTLTMLQKSVIALVGNHGKRIGSMLDASGTYNTSPVAKAYFVYCNSDLTPDLERLEGWIPYWKYASGSPMDNEIGACGEFRFIRNPDLPSMQNAATSVTASSFGLYSTGGTNPDVYQVLIFAQDAVSQVAVRGLDGGYKPFHVPASKIEKTDPGGQRGLVGVKWSKGAMIENDGWMYRLEVARRLLVD
jgi:N4-gp56 family major capsid protein